jgi:uncharacterized protein (DUF1330 family)
MAKGYWVGRVDVHDPDTYKNYVAANGAAFSKYGGRFLVRGGKYEAVKGASRSRNVVIEFPSYEAALECFHSPEYQAALRAQAGSAEVDLIVIEGYDGPQPG